MNLNAPGPPSEVGPDVHFAQVRFCVLEYVRLRECNHLLLVGASAILLIILIVDFLH